MRNRKLQIFIIIAVNHFKKDESWWNDVIFLAESKFNLFESNGRVMVWRKPNTELRPQNFKPIVKHGGRHVMVWGCISSKRVGNLVFVDGIMNQQSYLKILNDNLNQSAEKWVSKTLLNYIRTIIPSKKLPKYGYASCWDVARWLPNKTPFLSSFS